MRLVAVRIIALLLILNAVAWAITGWMGWQLTRQLVADLRVASGAVAPEEERLGRGVQAVAVLVGDAAEATAGFTGSLQRARDAVMEGSQAAAELGDTFEQMGAIAQVVVFGVQPFGGLAGAFAESAANFERLATSLGEAGESLAMNAADMERVVADMRQARTRIEEVATTMQEIRPLAVVQRGIENLEMGTRLILAVVLVQAALSGLTGAALLLLAGRETAVVNVDEKR
jgi:methyl-accepting chemotaxis protein